MISALTSKRSPESADTQDFVHCCETGRRDAARKGSHSRWDRSSSDALHLLLKRSPEPNLIIENGRFVDCNLAALHLLGLRAKEQLIGTRPCDCSPTEQADGRLSAEKAEEILSATAIMGSCRFEWQHVRKDTGIVPVEVTLTRVPLDGREMLYTTWRDLSGQELLRTALIESEALFRETFEQSEDAIILLDPGTWHIVDANSSAVRLYGHSRETLLEGGIGLFMENGECERFMHAVRLNNRGSNVRLEEGRHVTDDGKRLLVTTKVRRVTFHSKALLYCRFRDTTDQLRLEQETKLMESKLIHANKMTSLGTLVSSVAHDINNPNNFIMLNSSLLEEAWADVVRVLEDYTTERGEVKLAGLPFADMKDAVSRLISGVMEGSRRINSIVDSLKGFSQPSKKTSKESVNANAVVRMAASILSSHIKKHTNRFSLDLDETIPDVTGNSQQLEQVVINLVLNALQALPDKERGVRVITRFAENERTVVVRVEDEGTGIGPEVLAHIREPFFTTKLDSGGTGLGVYISHSILKGHSGSLDFESRADKGTAAIITLPVRSEE